MRPSVRTTTASTTSETTTRATCTSPERARRAHSSTLHVISHLIGSSSESHHNHLHSHPWRTLFDSLLPFYFHLFFPVFSFHVLHSELYSELDNPIVMESLCYSANKESEDAYDVSTSLTRLARLISYIHHTSEYWQCCHVGKHSTTMQTKIVSRLRFCRRLGRLEVNIRRNSVNFRKPNVRANKLDVLWDLVIEVFHSLPNQTNRTKDVRKLVGNSSVKHAKNHFQPRTPIRI